MRIDERYLRILPRQIIKSIRNVYLSALDISDRISGRADELTPPRALHFIGGGDFHGIGQNFLRHFIEQCNLQPDENILDIGCGTGRMAIPLLSHVGPAGSYTGFDISAKAIQWCQNHVTKRNSRFAFHFADIFNQEYNPPGRIKVGDYRFPCATGSMDFIFATSVFTHIRLPEARHYLEEIARVMSPKGRAFLTFFVLDEINMSLVNQGKASIDFSVELNDCHTIDPKTPERAVAFREDVLLEEFERAKLSIKKPILYGSWSGKASMCDAQDVIIATKH